MPLNKKKKTISLKVWIWYKCCCYSQNLLFGSLQNISALVGLIEKLRYFIMSNQTAVIK